MRTTVELDSALAEKAAKLASEKGCDLPHFIEEAVREKVAQTPNISNAVRQPFVRLTTVAGEGLCPGVNLDDSAALLDLMSRPT